MNYKILMVDDDRELLKMLNQYFTLKNYTVMIAENGIEAMEKDKCKSRYYFIGRKYAGNGRN